jgi:hypothetical protein
LEGEAVAKKSRRPVERGEPVDPRDFPTPQELEQGRPPSAVISFRTPKPMQARVARVAAALGMDMTSLVNMLLAEHLPGYERRAEQAREMPEEEKVRERFTTWLTRLGYKYADEEERERVLRETTVKLLGRPADDPWVAVPLHAALERVRRVKAMAQSIKLLHEKRRARLQELRRKAEGNQGDQA